MKCFCLSCIVYIYFVAGTTVIRVHKASFSLSMSLNFSMSGVKVYEACCLFSQFHFANNNLTSSRKP